MPIDSASLPDDVALLKRMVVTAEAEIEKLKAQIARLRRLQFGRSSEKLEATLCNWSCWRMLRKRAALWSNRS